MAYSAISKSSDHFTTHLYSGNDSTNNQTSLGMTPDLVWVKCRNNGTPSHYIVDKVRGNGKYISSNATTAEQTDSNTFDLVSGGFNLAGGNGWTNVSGRNYVAWNWKANGAGSANTEGTAANVTVSANTTAGFSIVQFDATQSRVSVGHGLGAVPDAILIKETEGASGWVTGGFGRDWSGYHSLQSNNAFNNDSNDSSGTGRMFTPDGYAPTSSLFYTNGSAFLSSGTKTCIAYVFKSITGFSKFGTYVGNGNSSDGSFVYTGFKPEFVMVKASSGADSWQMTDQPRDDNRTPDYARLLANATAAEDENQTWAKIEKLSNGFKLRSTDGESNSSGETYVYMAFGQSLVGSNNIPCTAR